MYFHRPFLHIPLLCDGTQAREVVCGPSGFPGGVMPTLHSLFFEAQRKKGGKKKAWPEKRAKWGHGGWLGLSLKITRDYILGLWASKASDRKTEHRIFGGLWNNKNPFLCCRLDMLYGSRFSFRWIDAKIIRMQSTEAFHGPSALGSTHSQFTQGKRRALKFCFVAWNLWCYRASLGWFDLTYRLQNTCKELFVKPGFGTSNQWVAILQRSWNWGSKEAPMTAD